MLNTNDSFLRKVISVGITGAVTVSIQTCSLIWTNNLIQTQKITNQKLTSIGKKLYKEGGLKLLFRGGLNSFFYTSCARFGDTAVNFVVLDFCSNNQFLKQTPLYLQSGFSWALASLWRLAMTPVGVLSNPQNLRNFNNMNFKYRTTRFYKKVVKPQINSLYSWFLVQNYLLKHTNPISYKQNAVLAFLRYSIIGFLSMSAYDTFKIILSQQINSFKMPSQFVMNKIFVKGLYGLIFCTSTHFLKEYFQK